MRSNRKELLIGFFLIAVILVITVLALKWLLGAIFSLEDKTEATVIGGIITFSLALFAFWKEIRKSRLEAHKEKKIEVYKRFSNMLIQVIKDSHQGKDIGSYVSSPEFMENMWNLKQGIIFYGSPKVIRTFNYWQKNAGSENTIQAVGNVLLAMRADLGLSNFGLTNKSIHEIYTRDDEAVENIDNVSL